MSTAGPFRAWGFAPGLLPPGPHNAITDVPGVRVGHYTRQDARHNTGVTVILPRTDPYAHKCTAACAVINGFGKTAGLVQMQELGQLETPIALTNTLNVGLVFDALVQYTAEAHPGLRSVNPVVGECNDAALNTIAERVIGYPQVCAALRAAHGGEVEQGCVGAGAGMVCHELKGGIGSASRVLALGGQGFTVGVLALCNHGQLAELNILGRRPGAAILARQQAAGGGQPRPADAGSCILVLGTDLPLSSRQLGRVARRCAVGLARCGSYWGHGSGDIAIAFTTAHDIPHTGGAVLTTRAALREDALDAVFAATAEAAEESVLNALAAARPTAAPDGSVCHALSEYRDLL